MPVRFLAAAKAFWGGARWHFVAALVAALLFSTISIAAQVLYLELDTRKQRGADHAGRALGGENSTCPHPPMDVDNC